MAGRLGACLWQYKEGLQMDIIVARDDAWGIGKDGELLRRISADMKRFRAMTTGNVLIIGRKTLESFPNGKPLPERVNIVLTKNMEYQAEGVVLCHSPEELPELLRAYEGKDIFVAGGGSISRQLLPLCRRAYVTHIHTAFPADTCFPNLDQDPDWLLVEKGETQEEKDIRFSFDLYENRRFAGK